MTRDRLWLAIGILLPALAATIAPVSAVDLAYQVRAGELMLASGAVLRTDPFTFTAMGDPWLNQQWGAGVLLAAVHGLGGWAGLVLLRALLVGAAVGLVVLACRRWLSTVPAALLVLGGFLVAVASLGLRAQLLGVVLFAAVLVILARRDRQPRGMWLIPILVVAWANLHGSFFLGPAAIGVAWLDDRRSRRTGADRLLVVLAASLVATCITPFGPAVWSYALGIATNADITRLVTEWQRTSPLTVTGAAFYVSLAGAAVILAAGWRRGVGASWPMLAWLAGLAVLGVYAERGVAWWAFGAPPALAPVVAWLLPAGRPPRVDRPALRRLNAVMAGLLAVLVVGAQPLVHRGDPFSGPVGALRDAPAGLARSLAGLAGPSDRVVVPQPWASWFEWASPGVPLLVDSRVEVVPSAAWEDYVAISRGGPGALTVLDRIGATAVVVDSRSQAELYVSMLDPGSGWQRAYEDVDGAVFVPST